MMGKEERVLTREEAIREETRRIRRLQISIRLAMDVISQSDMSFEDASRMVAATRRLALSLFPGKDRAYDLIYRPRLQRLMVQKYRLQ